MLNLLRAAFTRLRNRFFPRKRREMFKGIAYAGPHEDATQALRDHRLVLVGTPEKTKWLRFLCPCGCGEVQALNLMPSHSPVWTVTVHEDETITVAPSVDARGCGAHFWVRRNRIDWC